MRLLATCVVALSLTTSLAFSDHKPSEWSTYGAPITLKKSTKIDQVMTKQVGKEVLIEGTIGDVCQNKGCWMTVRDKKHEVRVEFKDYGFFVPWSTGGKSVRMQGVLTEKVMSPEDQKHIASESKEGGGVGTPAETPKKLFVFVASGVAIKGGGELSAEQKSKVGGNSEAHDHDHSAPGHKH
jgi:Domain of unknown function (DUF4920)